MNWNILRLRNRKDQAAFYLIMGAMQPSNNEEFKSMNRYDRPEVCRIRCRPSLSLSDIRSPSRSFR